MSIAFIRHALQAGYVHDWLVAGPLATPVPDYGDFQGDDSELRIARRFYVSEPGIKGRPAEGKAISVDGTQLMWEHFRCREDHLVDLTGFYHTCHYVRAWAYTRLASRSSREATFILTTNGPADVWVNGEHVHRREHSGRQIPRGGSFPSTLGSFPSTPSSFPSTPSSFPSTLRKGHNEILVRFEAVALRECPFVMALRVHDGPPGRRATGEARAHELPDVAPARVAPPSEQPAAAAAVLLPTLAGNSDRRRALEEMFEAAYLDRDVYAKEDEILVRLPEGMIAPASAVVRLQTPSGRIYLESLKLKAGAGGDASLGRAHEVPEGRYEAFLMPPLEEYYIGHLRVHRRIGLWAVTNGHSTEPYGTDEERRLEALEDAARREHGVFSEAAKMALGRWSEVSTDALGEAIAGVDRREAGSDASLLGLLGMLHRFGRSPSFPEALRGPLERSILGFKYWVDEPGGDAIGYSSEHHQILSHACEILAGQLYPDRVFASSGQSGGWHREKGERLAAAWLGRRGAAGFGDWDSNCSFEQDLLALSHLVDLATAPRIYDLAAVVADKLLFTMALNSYRGVFGSTHGRTAASMIKGGRLEATSGVGRLLWGMGTFNHHAGAVVGLACAADYELPPHISAIAADLPEELWSRERHVGELEGGRDRATGAREVNKVTYKTPDYMLSSAQDHRPGEQGDQEHIWQATLGPDAVVFVNHPACVSEDDSHRPSFWRGNAILPRTAQWKDVLISIHRLPEDDWLGFTHAYFPIHAFDEHALREDAGGRRWAFARKGSGYLALAAARGLELITRGDSAYRELRSYGQHNVWLCLMGRAALDGDFQAFQNSVLSLGVAFDGLSAVCPTLRGETLAFGWEGPLLRDGREEPITGFRHYESPYCVADLPSEQMEIRYGEQLLRLSLSEQEAER